ETSFPGLTRVSTVLHRGRCEGGVFVWEGKVVENGWAFAQEMLHRLDFATRTAEQRADLARRVVSEIAFLRLDSVSTSEYPPCTACEPLAEYHAPRAHLESDGGVTVDLWTYFEHLTRYRAKVGREGTLGAPSKAGRL